MTTKKQFNSFDEMLQESELPLLVDFYAPWCGPCQVMAQILEQVNAALHQELQVVKINTDQYPDIAGRFNVYALPTLVLFKNGQPVERIEGVVPAEQLVQKLQSVLKPAA